MGWGEVKKDGLWGDMTTNGALHVDDMSSKSELLSLPICLSITELNISKTRCPIDK